MRRPVVLLDGGLADFLSAAAGRRLDRAGCNLAAVGVVVAAAGESWYRAGFMPFMTAGLLAMLIDRGHIAGEWVVGGLEAKGFAYALVFLGLRCVALGQWSRVWLLLGAASAFHVLVGGWAVVAALVAWCITGERQNRLMQIPYLAAGLLLALPGLIPSAALTWGAEPAVTRQAAVIYVYERLSHHLVFHRLPTVFILHHIGLWIVWLGLFSDCAPMCDCVVSAGS